MKRPVHAFRATVFELETRALQAKLTPTPPAPPPPPPPPSTHPIYEVRFGGPASSPSNAFTQQVSQNSSVATVILSRSSVSGIVDGPSPGHGLSRVNSSIPPLQVQVTTDPSSPYVGVNVEAVNQTVTFAPGQFVAVLTVPIIAGAPNPGEVDVNLTMTPIDASPSYDLNITVPVGTLRILASDASIPPTIIATKGTPRGVELIFSKPMDPVQASKVSNYSVISQTTQSDMSSHFWPLLPATSRNVSRPVPLKSAEYNAATNTVTLIPRGRFPYGAGFFVTQGRPARPNAGTGASQGLVDLEGHPIYQTKTPGKFRVNVGEGYTVIDAGP